MKIGLCNKTTNEITDIMDDTVKNKATLESIKGKKVVISFDDSTVSLDRPLKFDGKKVVIDTDKEALWAAKDIEMELIEKKKDEMARAELIKEGKLYG